MGGMPDPDPVGGMGGMPDPDPVPGNPETEPGMVGIPVPDPPDPKGMVVAPASSTVAFWSLPFPFLSHATMLDLTLTLSPFKTKVKSHVQVFLPTFTFSPAKESARMVGTRSKMPNEIAEVLMVEE